jgi:hypothetical protein
MQALALGQAILDIRATARADAVLDPGSDPEAMLAYTEQLVASVEAQQAVAEHIQDFQHKFRIGASA